MQSMKIWHHVLSTSSGIVLQEIEVILFFSLRFLMHLQFIKIYFSTFFFFLLVPVGTF